MNNTQYSAPINSSSVAPLSPSPETPCYGPDDDCYTGEELFWFSFTVVATLAIVVAVGSFIVWRVWKLRNESELDFSL